MRPCPRAPGAHTQAVLDQFSADAEHPALEQPDMSGVRELQEHTPRQFSTSSQQTQNTPGAQARSKTSHIRELQEPSPVGSRPVLSKRRTSAQSRQPDASMPASSGSTYPGGSRPVLSRRRTPGAGAARHVRRPRAPGAHTQAVLDQFSADTEHTRRTGPQQDVPRPRAPGAPNQDDTLRTAQKNSKSNRESELQATDCFRRGVE